MCKMLKGTMTSPLKHVCACACVCMCGGGLLVCVYMCVSQQGLKAMDSNGLADPYVKLHLLPGASKVSTSDCTQ